jgi:hypothetical protein
VLAAGDLDRTSEASFRPLVVASDGQLSFEPMQLRFVVADAAEFDRRKSLAGNRKRFISLPGLAEGLGQQGEPMWAFEICSGRPVGINTLSQSGDAFLVLPPSTSAQPRKTIA